jgi:hypothetical protein
MANSIDFSFDDPLAKPTDELPSSYTHTRMDVEHPAQTADGEEYLCGNSGNAHPYANAGRDQDRSRADERVPAQGCARYVT